MKRVGIDIGGTFTDLVYWDDEAGQRLIHKLPSTPANPAQAGLEGLQALCKKAGVSPPDIDLLLHGTTVATNALLEGKGATVGMITTRGFRDILHIGRKNRPLNFSHSQDVARQHRPLVARRHRRVVNERVSAPDGAVLQALDEQEVRREIRALRDEGEVNAVAICCLFSFLNPEHEKRIRNILREEWPDVFASCSHEVVPLYREYERFSTTALNAYVGPKTANYLLYFSSRLRESGFKADLGLMTSAGGVVSAVEAAESPVSLLLSGPVGALVAGIEAGRLVGQRSVITLDVGGTSADIGVAPDGELRLKHLLDTRIGDYDAMVPMCDIATIGAGGGSIARVDEGGMFRVGPESAGADPGPVCYGKGGTEPTVTDAIVALGWYRPIALRESGLEINPILAEAAIRQKIAGPLGLSVTAAAAGIFRIAVNNMAEAIRVNSVAKGFDPREFALLAYGGAGAAFVVAVARELAISKVIIPPLAGVGAAGGLLASDMKYQRQATLWQRLDTADAVKIRQALQQLSGQARERLQRDGFNESSSEIRFTADCRYLGQGYELVVELPVLPDDPGQPVSQQWLAEVASRFHAAHERAYNRTFADRPIMMVNIAATGVGRVPPLHNPQCVVSAAQPGGESSLTSFMVAGQLRAFDTSFVPRTELGAGSQLQGPAIIEQSDTITVLSPGCKLEVGRYGHLLISLQSEAEL